MDRRTRTDVGKPSVTRTDVFRPAHDRASLKRPVLLLAERSGLTMSNSIED